MARIISVDRIPGLRYDIEAGRRSSLYDDDLYQEYLGNFVFGPPAELRIASSIIVMAASQSQVRLTFRRNGAAVAVTVPPTYLRAREIHFKGARDAGQTARIAWLPGCAGGAAEEGPSRPQRACYLWQE